MYCLSFVKNVKRHIKICAGALLLISSTFLYGQSTPYDKQYGDRFRGIYTFHNFIGEEPDIIAASAKSDLEKYLYHGVAYLQAQFNGFSQSVADRPNIQRYFAQITFNPEIEQKHHRQNDLSAIEKLDYYINQLAESFELVMTDIINNLRDSDEKEAFVLCYRIMVNEAYREGLGKARNSNNAMMEKYKREREEVLELWNKNKFINGHSLVRDIDNPMTRSRYSSTIDKIAWLIKAANKDLHDKREYNNFYAELTEKDLWNFFNLTLNIGSLQAMHDYTAKLMRHKDEDCTIKNGLVAAMEAEIH